MTITIHTEAELHKLLDSLTDGQIVTARWDNRVIASGSAHVDDAHVSCGSPIRHRYDRKIDSDLTAVSVTTREEVTVARDDETAMHALLDGLTDGERITVEYRDGDKLATCTGPADVSIDSVIVRHAVGIDMVRWGERDLHESLHSITVTRPTTVRWERKA